MAMRRKKNGAERKKKKEKERWSGKQQWSKAKAMEPATQNSSRKPCRKKTTQVKQSRQEWEWKPGSSDYRPLRTQTCTLQTVTQLKVEAHRRGKAFSPHCCSYGEGKANYFSGKIKTNNPKPRQLPQLSAEDMRHAQLQKDAKAELRGHTRAQGRTAPLSAQKGSGPQLPSAFCILFPGRRNTRLPNRAWELWPHMYHFQFGMTGQFFIYS